MGNARREPLAHGARAGFFVSKMQEKHKRIVEVFVESLSETLHVISESDDLEKVIKMFQDIEQDSRIVTKILEKLTRVK